MKPFMATATSVELSDEQLVTAAKAGSREAFEALFRRYRSRIAGQVRSSVKDDARSEDIVQEIFISALKSLPTLESADAFRPWLDRIARNACIDHARQAARMEEISIYAVEIQPHDRRSPLLAGQTTHGAASQREDLAHLRQAFTELPRAQHQALVLRELEGLSYDEIGRRMGITRGAVESVLFRARRALRAEYGEVATGERCRQVRSTMAVVSEGMGTASDKQSLVRHLGTCASCRRESFAMGLGQLALLAKRGPVRRAVSKAASFVPIPWFLNRRADAPADMSSGAAGSGTTIATQAHGALAQLAVSGGTGFEQAGSIVHKAAAVIAAVAVVGGGGIAARESGIPLPIPKLSDAVKGGDEKTSVDTRKGALPTDRKEAFQVLYGAPPEKLPPELRLPSTSSVGGTVTPEAISDPAVGAAPPELPTVTSPAAVDPAAPTGTEALPVAEPVDSAPASPDPGALGPIVVPPTDPVPVDPGLATSDTGTPLDSGGWSLDPGVGGPTGSSGPTIPDTGASGPSGPTSGFESVPPGIQKKLDHGGSAPPGIGNNFDLSG